MSVSRQYVLKHYQELMRRPLPNVSVAPNEDDFQVWHVNFFFPKNHEHFPRLILHFKMSFDGAYPSSSPNVSLFTTMRHSHVHGHAVCFSLLPDYRGYFEATNTPKSAYWNPARTVRSFLEDLYTFLLVDDDQHVSISAADGARALKEARDFSCSCGHSFAAPHPAPPTASNVSSSKKVAGDNRVLNGHEDADAESAGARCNLPPETIEDLRCSITRSLFLEEGVVMGFGVAVEHLPGGKLKIETDLSPMSSRAFFQQHIRTTSDGNKITNFIPYVINDQHFTPAAKQMLSQTVESITSGKDLNPLNGLLLVLGEIWKSKAVELMSGREHASEKALKGFCAIHHLLLTCARTMPLVTLATQKVRESVASPDNFTKDKVPDLGQFLTLFLLSALRWNGPEKAGSAVVRELLVRNALWITKADPSLANTAAHKADRCALSWGPSATGLKLVALQIRFLLALPAWATSFRIGAEAGLFPSDAQPPPPPPASTAAVSSGSSPASGASSLGAGAVASGSEADAEAPGVSGEAARASAAAGWSTMAKKKPTKPASDNASAATDAGAGWEVWHMYNALGGRPTEDMLAAFQLECKKVQAMAGYADFFGALGLGMPTEQQCHDMLEGAMTRSAVLGYHGRGGTHGRGGRGRGRGRS